MLMLMLTMLMASRWKKARVNDDDEDDDDDESRIRQGCGDLCGSVTQLKVDQDITIIKTSSSSKYKYDCGQDPPDHQTIFHP